MLMGKRFGYSITTLLVLLILQKQQQEVFVLASFQTTTTAATTTTTSIPTSKLRSLVTAATTTSSSSSLSSVLNDNNNKNKKWQSSLIGSSTLPKSLAFHPKIHRGGSSSTTAIAMSSSTTTPAAAVPAATNTKKIRIVAFDSIRFLLIIGIVFGHFFSFATPQSIILQRFFSQHNVLVGAFFALSGYVTAYTSTENASRQVSSKVLTTPKPVWILQKVLGYGMLHWIVLLLFSPMFIFVDMKYNGPIKTAWNAILSFTMTQAYFPNTGAEVWNAPTWFLSALTLATAIVPYILPSITSLNKKQLTGTGFWIYVLGYLLPKIGYCQDYKSWFIAEGVTAPKVIPNLAAFNTQRFLPLFAVAEVLLGIIACRIVMLDNDPDELSKTKDKKSRTTNGLSTAIPFLGLIGFLYARAIPGLIEMSDILARSIIFVPLFLRFLMAAHRNTVAGIIKSDILLSILSSKLFVTAGSIVFPIFIVHGPLGQVFFKKIIATTLFGTVLKGPYYFTLYILSTIVSAFVLQKLIVENKIIQSLSNTLVTQLSKWF